MRALVIAVALIASTAWPCTPEEPRPYARKGHTGLELHVNQRSTKLVDASGVQRWSLPVYGSEAVFAPDDSWVAFSPGLGALISIVRTAKGAQAVTVSVLNQLLPDERSLLTRSSCGDMWFEGFEATDRGLVVHVSQNGQARPTEPNGGALTFLVTPDGVVSREGPSRTIDLLSMAELWKGPATPERANVLYSMSRLLGTPTGREQAASLGRS
jgi:hypothetical protein